MTGICGIVRKRTDPAISDSEADALLSAVANRGGSGIRTVRDAGLFLVQLGSGVIPPAKNKFFESAAENYIILGDVRLDNRKVLAENLNLGSGSDHSDTEIVLKSYRKWGASCCERFRGAFAFAIWNGHKRELFLARDQFGIRPLFYRDDQDGFRFASQSAALKKQDVVDITGDFVGRYLANKLDYSKSTRFQDVSRLIGGHWLLRSDNKTMVSKYWMLEPAILESDKFEEQFLELFEKSVRARLSDDDVTATFLSGGLDSTAISTIAEQIRQAGSGKPLKTYSMRYLENKGLDESSFVNAVLSIGNYDPKFLQFDDYDPLNGLYDSMVEQGGPYVAPGLVKFRRCYREIARDGVQVVLDGHGGDEVVGPGLGPLADLARSGHWFKVASLVPTVCNEVGDSSFGLLLALARNYGGNNQMVRIAYGLYARAITILTDPTPRLPAAWERFLNNDFIEKTHLRGVSFEENRVREDNRKSGSSFHKNSIISPILQLSFEELDNASKHAGIELRYPFFDIELARFCLALPASEKLQFRQTRSVMRRSLRHVYPAAVRKRQQKTWFSSELAIGLAVRNRRFLEAVASDKTGVISSFIKMDVLAQAIGEFIKDPLITPIDDVYFFWRLSSLYLWLNPGLKNEFHL